MPAGIHWQTLRDALYAMQSLTLQQWGHLRPERRYHLPVHLPARFGFFLLCLSMFVSLYMCKQWNNFCTLIWTDTHSQMSYQKIQAEFISRKEFFTPDEGDPVLENLCVMLHFLNWPWKYLVWKLSCWEPLQFDKHFLTGMLTHTGQWGLFRAIVANLNEWDMFFTSFSTVPM